jgi:TonB family protein
MFIRVLSLIFPLMLPALGTDLSPVVSRLEPRNGAPGTIVKLSGTALDKSKVEEVYLTDHRFNLMVKVLEQENQAITVRIPPFAKPGRYQILFLSRMRDQQVLLEQPVYLMVEEGAATMTTAAAPPPAPEPKATPALSKPDPAPPVQAPVQTAAIQPRPVQPAPVQQQTVQAQPVQPQPIQAPPTQQEAVQPEPAPSSAEQTSISLLTPLEILKKTPPMYPAIAKSMKLAGEVIMNVTVDGNGKVSKVEVIKGHPILSEAAVYSVKKWEYKPAMLRGTPLASTTTIVVRFGAP